MKNQSLADKIAALSERQATAVQQFIDYLQQGPNTIADGDFRLLLDSFVREHSELLRRLAE